MFNMYFHKHDKQSKKVLSAVIYYFASSKWQTKVSVKLPIKAKAKNDEKTVPLGLKTGGINGVPLESVGKTTLL